MGNRRLRTGLRDLRDSHRSVGRPHWTAQRADPDCSVVVRLHVLDRRGDRFSDTGFHPFSLRRGGSRSLPEHFRRDRPLVPCARARPDPGFHLGREPYGRRTFAADRCAAAVGRGMAVDLRSARYHRNRLGGFLEGGLQRPSRSRRGRTRAPAFRCALGGVAPAAPAVAHLRDVFFPGLGLLVLFRLVPGLSGQSQGLHRSRDGRLFRPSVFVWGLWKRRRRIPERPARGSLGIEDWTSAGWFCELGDVGPSTRRHDDDPR